MKSYSLRKHSVHHFMLILLLGFFMLFLLVLLLFFSESYRNVIAHQQRNHQVYTAIQYLTNKANQNHDGIYPGHVEDEAAICFRSFVEDREYTTYLYLDEGDWKELFTATDHEPYKNMGTRICQLKKVELSTPSSSLLAIEIQADTGASEILYLNITDPEKGGRHEQQK